MCETSFSYVIPARRRDSADVQPLIRALSGLPECSVIIRTDGELVSGSVQGGCTAFIDETGRMIQGRCLARGFRENGIYVQDGQSCSSIK